jgi:hypothetical protein
MRLDRGERMDRPFDGSFPQIDDKLRFLSDNQR